MNDGTNNQKVGSSYLSQVTWGILVETISTISDSGPVSQLWRILSDG